jgi:DNA-binding GntR family transcriptional regulator
MPFVPTDAFDAVPPADRRTLTDTVYEHLRDRLAIGSLAPGERLSLREISSLLGVSVMPVREAVNRLVAENALEITQGRVLRVPLTTAQRLRDLADIRAEIEGFAAERAASLRTPAQLDAIEAAEAALRKLAASRASDAGAWILMNRTLHFSIYQAAGLPLLSKMIADLWLRAGPVVNRDIRAGSERHISTNSGLFHANAVAAIRAQDPAAARDAIASDISGAAAYIIGNSEWLAE